MDIDIQKQIFNKLVELNNKDKELFEGEGIYKYFTKKTKSIIIYDVIIYKFKVLKYNIIEDDTIIFIELCYDEYTNNLKINSNLLYKIYNLYILDDNCKKISEHKINNKIKEIFIIFLQKYVNNKEIYDILDLIIKQIYYDYKINITNNDILLSKIPKYNSLYNPSNTKMIIPPILANQIILYKEKQIREDNVKLQRCFYKINKTDKIYYILLNENEGDYYINIIYQYTEGNQSYLISTNIIDSSFPEKNIIIEKIKEQIYRYNMPCYIKEDIIKICHDKFILVKNYE
mgnify:CR=1 FL=1|uniref:Uncharacterized protein n=1 Tax=viral metagenome TaxID=1070528 RepID=A0A6C0J2I7_9ZZZZ